MSQKFLTPLDLAKNELQNAAIQNLASAPGSPVAGQTYYDTTNHHTYVYNGTSWEQASGGGGSGTVTTVSVVSTNGFAGSVATATSTPAITLTTTITGLLKGNGTAISAAASGTDYAPATATTSALKGNGSGGFSAATLNDVGAATADYSLNSHKLTNVTDPTSAQDAATKNYVDATVQGLQVKPTARVATTAALATLTYANGTSGVGATLTASANGTLTVDGVLTALGDLILVKDQASGFQNGLYTVTTAGAAGAAFVLTRHADMDTTGEFSGALIPVGSAGTANGNSLWLANPSGAVTVGTTSIPLTELNKAADLAAGTGITISGNTVSVATTYAGGTSIATVGTITAGTWTGTSIAVLNGGTGSTTAAGARTNLGATGKYSALIGDGSSASIAITQGTHGLASNGQMVAFLYDASTGAQVLTDTSINNSNGTVTFAFATAPASNAYRAVLVG